MRKVYADETPMPFGKYKGIRLANVPADYLLYLYDSGLDGGPLRRYIDNNLEALRSEVKELEEKKGLLRTMYGPSKR